MKTTKINVDAYMNGCLIEKADMDVVPVGNYLDMNYFEHAKLLDLPSSYLWGLSGFQRDFIDYNKIPYENLNNEQKLKTLLYQDKFNQKEFEKLYSEAQNKADLIYDRCLREKLLEIGIIETSEPNNILIRHEFIRLNKALSNKDLNEIYKYSYQVSSFDFKEFTEDEKDIVIKTLQISSEGVALAIGRSLEEDKIHYGSWGKFWKTISNYNLGDDLEENQFISQKSMCIERDFCDERINMSMFPNLPTIYDEDEYYVSYEIEDVDWNLTFELHEIDFLLAVALTHYGEERLQFQAKIDEYILVNNIFSDRNKN